jgi:hypothetical protein
MMESNFVIEPISSMTTMVLDLLLALMDLFPLRSDEGVSVREQLPPWQLVRKRILFSHFGECT